MSGGLDPSNGQRRTRASLLVASIVQGGRRRRRWPFRPQTRRPGYVLAPRPLVEPLSTVEEDYFASFSFYRRVGFLLGLATIAFLVLGLRAWSLQVLHGGTYVRQSQREQVRVVDLPGTRGVIVDARGRPLAAAGARLTIVADAPTLGRWPGPARWTPSTRGRRTLRRFARLAGVREATLVRRIRSSLVRSPFAPAVVLPRATRSLSFYVDEREPSFPGLHVVALPTRDYPQGSLGGEFLGLLGQVSPAELNQKAYARARPGEVVGQSGVEATYDRFLNGGFTRARVHVDAAGRIVSPLRVLPAKRRPASLQLTIDARIQRTAERAVRDGIALAHKAGYTGAHAGAGVVLNPRTGGIYALASYPSFNQVRAAQEPDYFSRLIRGHDPRLPLLNRATQGIYPAGSTFKPIVAAAALGTRLITPSTILQCTGSLLVGNIVFHNVEPAINASLNLPQALEISCDTWFYRLGEQFYALQQRGTLGIQRWARWLGLGRPTEIDIPGESSGIVPTPAWLRKTFRGTPEEEWYEGTSVNLSIGQGYLAVTPLQLAVAYAALANGGTVVRPHVAQALLTAHGRVPLRFRPLRRLHLRDVWAIRDGLYAAAHEPLGTSASVFSHFPVPVAGKTGTAQTPNGSDDSWYASWAPSGHPRVVVVVLIEHGGFGADAAAPAAREIYSAFFHVRRSG